VPPWRACLRAAAFTPPPAPSGTVTFLFTHVARRVSAAGCFQRSPRRLVELPAPAEDATATARAALDVHAGLGLLLAKPGPIADRASTGGRRLKGVAGMVMQLLTADQQPPRQAAAFVVPYGLTAAARDAAAGRQPPAGPTSEPSGSADIGGWSLERRGARPTPILMESNDAKKGLGATLIRYPTPPTSSAPPEKVPALPCHRE
jgi:hypothetical protein